MKFIKIFVVTTGAFIVCVILALFLAGRRPGAGRVSGVVTLDQPPAAVMPWLTEPARLERWVGWLRQVDGDTTAAAVGRKQTWHMDAGESGTLPLSVEITGYWPPDSLQLHRSVPGFLEGDNRYTLTAAGGGTRLAVEEHDRYPNFVVGLLEPFATPQAKRKLNADLARLDSLIAGDARAGAPDGVGAER